MTNNKTNNNKTRVTPESIAANIKFDAFSINKDQMIANALFMQAQAIDKTELVKYLSYASNTLILNHFLNKFDLRKQNPIQAIKLLQTVTQEARLTPTITSAIGNAYYLQHTLPKNRSVEQRNAYKTLFQQIYNYRSFIEANKDIPDRLALYSNKTFKQDLIESLNENGIKHKFTNKELKNAYNSIYNDIIPMQPFSHKLQKGVQSIISKLSNIAPISSAFTQKKIHKQTPLLRD